MPASDAERHRSRRRGAAGIAVGLAIAALILIGLTSGLDVVAVGIDDAHALVAAPDAADTSADATPHAVLPAAVTVVVAFLVTLVVTDTRLRPPSRRRLTARDRSPPSTIGC